jgi:predicted amidohydrolase YtcJ
MASNKASLVLQNANVVTLDRRCPRAETIYLNGERILQVSTEKINSHLITVETEVLDCAGRTVIPGFQDAHCHIKSYADSLININLGPTSVRSIEDIVSRVRESAAAAREGTWIRCAGYDEFYLAERRHPIASDLDRSTTSHPVKLTHRSGHAHVLNSLGMSLAGIGNETEEPPGAMIERDADTGLPNGLLYGMGHYLSAVVPAPGSDEMTAAVGRVDKMLLSMGVTSIQDASPENDLTSWKQFLRWKSTGIFAPRTTIMFGLPAADQLPLRDPETGLASATVKIIVDEVRGTLNPSQGELNEIAVALHDKGLQMAIHAVEENAVRAAIVALCHALEKHPGKHLRHRIEHCSICSPNLATKLAEVGAMVVTNPAFIYHSGERYLATVPDYQMNHLYAIRTMMDCGVTVAAGSDAPIASPDPLLGIYAAITRKSQSGSAIVEKERISPGEAIMLYTLNAAYSQFQEDALGSISSGKYADLVVLSDDPLRSVGRALQDIQVEATVLAGKVVYRRNR